MSAPPATITVLVGERFACIRIAGRATFNCSIDFKTLLYELKAKGYTYFVLDLSECALMDSTFLGVLAGFGLKMMAPGEVKDQKRVNLLNPNPRISELLDTLGVLDLFSVSTGNVALPEGCTAHPTEQGEHTREQTTRACLEAHETLMSLKPENAAKFKDVAQFLSQDLKRLKSASPS